MSKPSTASTAKIPASQPPAKSAWTRGPPISTTSSSTPRSQSPASANATQPSTPTHSRKPSALGGPPASSTTIRDGVSVPRSIQSTQKPATGLSFGSIAEPSAPISSSPASVPAVSSDASSVKSFGSIPAANGISGKTNLSRSTSKSSTPAASSSPSPTPGTKPKVDVKSFFRTGPAASSAPSPTTTTAPEGSPAQRPVTIPPGQAPPQPQGYYSRPNGPPPTGMATSSTTGPPRSPQYSRQMNNGTGGRNAPPNSAGLGPSSPRMSSMQAQHPPQPHQMPHAVPQQPPHPGMPMQWGYYYQPYAMDPAYMQYGWQQQTAMHPPPTPHSPATHAVASPSRPPAVLHNGPPPAGAPSTPTPAPATPSPYAYPYQPPATPQTPTNRLNSTAPAFVPNKRASSAIKIRNPDNGEPVDLSAVASPVAPSSEANASPAQTPITLGHQRKPTVVRLESEETRKKRVQEEQQRKEKEEQEKREQDRIAKLKRDFEEKKKRKEEEEKKRKEEEERKKQEAEERKKKEEEEKKRKEEEEKRKEEEERLRKEEEEKERLRKEEEEKERLRKEEEEKKRREEEEKKQKEEEAAKERERKAQEEAASKAKEAESERLRKEAEEKAKDADKATESAGSPAPSLATPAGVSRSASPLPASDAPKSKRPVPGPLDLSATTKPGLPPAPLSALATARAIVDLDKIQYPEGILSPKPELNKDASQGRFRYDRDFLLQFMAVCKDKPDSLPALDAIGLEPADQTGSIGRSRGNSRTMGPPASIPTRAGLGIGGVFGPKGGPSGSNFMGNFGAGTGKISSEERFAASQMARSASLGGPPSSVAFPRPTPMVRTASQGGATPSQSSSLNPTGRTRSQRGGGRRHDSKVGAPQERDRTMSTGPGGAPLEPVEPLKLSENRWTPMKKGAVDTDSPEVVERKVKALLNKLTMEKFDSISDQIIEWANRSEKEKDGRTLIQVIKLVFEKATDEAAWSEMYARLCRKMMEKISQNVQDEGIRTSDGRPIAGGQLFRKYLLNRCQEDFERGWSMKEAATRAAEGKAADDKAIKEAAEKAAEASGQAGEEVLYSDEYYAAQKAKRRGLGLVKFIGELFKLQMLTERIMHECIKKLLGNVENPEEEEIESLCKLLTTVGRQLDTEKARSHMDVYFQRMRELTKNLNITSRMQFMLLDVLELRDRKWVPRTAQAAPTTLAAVHEQAAKDQAKAQAENQQSMRSLGRESMSRGGSRRGEQRGGQSQPGPDGWTNVSATRPAGDLTQFGKISKGPFTLGPGSVFAAKSKDAAKGRDASVSRTASTSNMFAMLNSDAAAEPPAPGKSSRPPSRKPSADFTQTGITEPPQRRKLNLLPRSKPVGEDTKAEEEDVATSQAPSEDEAEPTLTDDQAKAKIDENVKEFWAIRDLDEAELYFTGLPQSSRGRFVDKLVGSALERKEADAGLLGQLLGRASEKGTCSPEAMEEGFAPQIEFIADIAIDVPAAYKLMAIILKGSKLPKTTVEDLADKIVVEDEPVVHPKERLVREYEKL